jgi:hypothetical protein
MALETTNRNLSTALQRCDECDALRTHSTQNGYEQPDGSIQWREEVNGCGKHRAVPLLYKLDGSIVEWKG